MNFFNSVRLKIAFLTFGIMFCCQTGFGQTNWSPVFRFVQTDLNSVYFTSAEKGFIGGDGGVFAFTNDGGQSWTKQPLNTNDTVNEIFFRNEDNGYLLVGKHIFITNDGGKSWRENQVIKSVEFGGRIPDFLSVRFSGKKKGWIVGSLLNNDDEVIDSLVLQTQDSGETWSRVTVPSDKLELYHVDFVNDETGWVVGDKGLILATKDGGQTWKKQTSGTDVGIFNVDFRDSSNGVVVGSKGTILRTENGGTTWEKVTAPVVKKFLRVNFINDKTGFIVGGGGTILRTEDKGKTWTKINSQTTESLYGLFSDKKSSWAVGEKGLMLRLLKN